MPKFNPDFWEVPVPPEYFEQFSTEECLRYQSAVDAHTSEYRAKQQRVLQQIRHIIGNELTYQQARCYTEREAGRRGNQKNSQAVPETGDSVMNPYRPPLAPPWQGGGFLCNSPPY